ncbi:MAG TPA: hypothetical protein VFN49_01040, partial [Candidatus Aquilonibacter sp.]|nr:hypothetical protein [Candidatus Aquilonibacter sp.]
MLLVAPLGARAQSLRHLVYTFTVGINSSQHDTTAANGISSMAAPGESNQILSSGDNAYNGEVSDKGEISLDIVGMRPDGGLVVTANESAKERHERDDTCVVYASTNALCTDPATYQEIYAVIRTLSPN